MKIKYYLLFALIVGVVSVFAFYPNPGGGDPDQKEAVTLKSMISFLDRVHFSPKEIDDSFSKNVFKTFLEMLDGGKRFLTQAEIAKLKPYELRLDEDIKSANFDFFNLSTELLNSKQSIAKGIIDEILAKPMEFSSNEEISIDFEHMDFPKNDTELKDKWRLTLKADVLAELVRLQKAQDTPMDSASMEKPKEKKSFVELEKEAREEVKKDYEKLFERIDKLRREDRLSDYFNSISTVYDPHTNYFSPNDKEDFNIGISGKLEGIGARLQNEGEFTKVNEIVVGGPAWKQKELEANDVIMKVRQENKEAVDIRGMRIDDVVSQIRGKKGTKVTLTVKKVSGAVKDITITRDEVLMEESFAKSAIIGKTGIIDNVGYIYLPKFYANFENKDGRYSFSDVENEVNKLKNQGVEGIILDLRDNPGGSLNDVVKMSGLFIEQGPIVQVKSRDQEPYVMSDEDSDFSFDGPMVVLVNHQSASASEILAGALQDYKRAVIVGSNSTYGKGTVQRFFNLDKAVSSNNAFKPLGEIKATIQKYYRVNGGSTQLNGVVPDIILPDVLNYIDIGEKENENAMEWSKINPANYAQNVFVIKNMNDIVARSKARTQNDPIFKAIDDNAKRIKTQSDKKSLSLNIDKYSNELDQRKAEDKKYNELFKELDGFTAKNMHVDLAHIERDSGSIHKNEQFLKKLKKDVYLQESLYIIKDLQNNKMAASDSFKKE